MTPSEEEWLLFMVATCAVVGCVVWLTLALGELLP